RVDGELVSERGRTGNDGFFYWCKDLAVGQDAELRVWRTGEAPRITRTRLEKQLTAVAVHMLPEGAKAAEFAGFVAASDGEQPISAADVFVTDLDKHAFTDAQGKFRISEIPPGDHDVTVRKVGFAPVTTRLTFAAGPTPQRKVLMDRISVLDTVSVTATVTQQWKRDFEDNKKLGLGKFWDRAAMEALDNSRLSSILSDLARSTVVRGRGNAAWIARSGATLTLGGTDRSTIVPDEFDVRLGAKPACYADVFVDNIRVYSGRNGEPLFDLNSISPSQIESMEYYADPARTPAKFSNLNTVCGTLVIWTRD
ncbi:MAG TPA: carboxypeptidase-like regulatory domain-containing protein, partial [Gemmatimonadaceae bacterium]